MLENRRHLRFRQPMDMSWSMPEEDATGQGTILNISSSGSLVRFDNSFIPSDKAIVSIDPQSEDKNEIPLGTRKAKVIWFRKLDNLDQSFLCGLQFLNEKSSGEDLAQWIEQKTQIMSQTMDASILRNYLA